MVQWLRMQELGKEVLGLNSGCDQLIFFDIIYAPFLPPSDCSIRVSRSHDFTIAWFFAVSLLLF